MQLLYFLRLIKNTRTHHVVTRPLFTTSVVLFLDSTAIQNDFFSVFYDVQFISYVNDHAIGSPLMYFIHIAVSFDFQSNFVFFVVQLIIMHL